MKRWVVACATFVACGGSGAGPSRPGTCAASDAVWAATDYSSSAVGALSLGGTVTSTRPTVDLGADPALAVSRGRAFFVARLTDTIFELDPGCGTPMARFSAHVKSSAGTSDPYDVAVARDGSLWIPLYEGASLLVLTPAGDTERVIDLSGYDTDGNPDASAVAIVDTPAGEKAFVALQRLNPYPRSVQPSWMLRVDVVTRTVEAQVPLAGRNPFAMVEDGGILWLAEPGNFDDATEPGAGVERFDTAGSSTALVAREPDLGGSVAELAVSDGCGAAIVADATPNVNATSLATFDPAIGGVLSPAARSPLATAGFDLEGLEWSGGGALLVGDRRRAPAGYPVHVFDRVGPCGLTPRSDATFLPLPPVALRVPR